MSADKHQRPGRRCDVGCESWPDDDEYEVCPICGEDTTRYTNLTPISEDEAQTIKAYMFFEGYYEDHCASKNQSVDGALEPTQEQHEKYDALYPGGRPDAPAQAA